MSHCPDPTVKSVLVQSPCACFSGRSTCSVPVEGGVVVDGVDVDDVPPEAAVVAEDGAVEVLVAEDVPVTVVVWLEPAGGGGVYPWLAFEGDDEPLGPQECPTIMPRKRAMTTATMSCQVLQDTRCLMPSSPGRGGPERSTTDDPVTEPPPFASGLPNGTVACCCPNVTTAA